MLKVNINDILSEIINDILSEISNALNNNDLEALRIKYLGKASIFTDLLKGIADLPLSEKKAFGSEVNEYKKQTEEAIKTKFNQLQTLTLQNNLKSEYLDLSLNSQQNWRGGLHPLTAVTAQIVAIFGNLGYKIAHANEIEDDWHNFTALNVPAHHPARQNHDTFYVNTLDNTGNNKLLRTHTSNTQVYAMQAAAKEEQFKPIKIISPGKTYRSDSDSTHSPMFHQIELLHVDTANNISIPQLKALLSYFLSKFFDNNNLKLRFRPSYFPFTSPSFEVDIQCKKTKDALLIGEGNDWLEILGCGVVNKTVINNCGLDSNLYTGIALGAGIERLAMLKYNLRDLRHMFEGDVRWLSYYNFGSIYKPSIFGGL